MTEADDIQTFETIEVAEHVTVTSLEELQQVLDRHADWHSSVLVPSRTINGQRANLENNEFAGWDLRAISLPGATLTHCNFEGANLEGADFTGAHLARCNMRGANLRGARLRRANLAHADLRGAILEDTDFKHAKLDFCRTKEHHETHTRDLGPTTSESSSDDRL